MADLTPERVEALAKSLEQGLDTPPKDKHDAAWALRTLRAKLEQRDAALRDLPKNLGIGHSQTGVEMAGFDFRSWEEGFATAVRAVEDRVTRALTAPEARSKSQAKRIAYMKGTAPEATGGEERPSEHVDVTLNGENLCQYCAGDATTDPDTPEGGEHG